MLILTEIICRDSVRVPDLSREVRVGLRRLPARQGISDLEVRTHLGRLEVFGAELFLVDVPVSLSI